MKADLIQSATFYYIDDFITLVSILGKYSTPNKD